MDQIVLKNQLVKIELILFFMRLFSCIGFGMLYAGISIFLLNHLKMETNLALSIVGVFIALHYSLSLLSGFFSGKWISPLGALAISVLLQAVAIGIIYNSSTSFFIGVAIFLVGNMAGSTSINMIITQSFTVTNNIQERVFLRNYAGQNLGSMIGFSLAGYFQLWGNITHISYIASPLMLITKCPSIRSSF
ncbi:MAG: hypothetical protein KBD37_02380 [Burkholderiales bacterium]|nr:hypothetical protein [Burkholderiales bacterium]